MSKPTPQELEQLDRLARKHHGQLHFLRHSPREQRNLPFEEDFPPRTSIGEALVGSVVFFLFISALVFAPWWMML
jgi:hypothetical protein